MLTTIYSCLFKILSLIKCSVKFPLVLITSPIEGNGATGKLNDCEVKSSLTFSDCEDASVKLTSSQAVSMDSKSKKKKRRKGTSKVSSAASLRMEEVGQKVIIMLFFLCF